MTKGPFTLIPVGGAIAGELIIKQNWRQLFHWRWLVAIVLVATFISPELYSLWYQFDSHPEKTVFGKTNVSGIRFFLWDSQFGRFLNTTPMKGKGDPTFFIHTLLWAFLPWSLLMFTAIFQKIRIAAGTKLHHGEEWFTICGSLLTLLIFSISRFQLSYYTNILFPFFAILTAQYIWKLQPRESKIFKVIHNCIIVILLIGGILLQIFYQPATPSFIQVLLLAAVLILLVAIPYWLKVNKTLIALYRVGVASLAINLYINWFFYPDLLKYQSSTEAAYYINDHHPGLPGVCMSIYAPAFEFYLKNGWIKSDTSIMYDDPHSGVFYIMQEELDDIKRRGIRFEMIKELDEFHVTMLTLKFINKKTRYKELKKHYLVKLL
jgi:hypothetical protein